MGVLGGSARAISIRKATGIRSRRAYEPRCGGSATSRPACGARCPPADAHRGTQPADNDSAS
jgi:hypothetical protein